MTMEQCTLGKYETFDAAKDVLFRVVPLLSQAGVFGLGSGLRLTKFQT